MRECVVGTGFFIAPGRKRINPVLLAAIALAMAGCSHSSSEAQFSLAPPPPAFDPNAPYESAEPPRLMAFTGQAIPFPSHIPLNNARMPLQENIETNSRASLKTETEADNKCRIQDRFDRGALIAYQWGRNRVGVDVDGISVGNSDLEAVKLQYTLRLQPEKSRNEKCRYESHWQGMIGSGYNEMFLRKKNTIWNQLDKISDDAEDAFDKLF